MAKINFPSSPTNGQTFNQNGVYYTYDSTFGAWVTALVPKPLDNSRNTQIIFNDATYANGSNGMVFDKASNTATFNNVAVTLNVSATYFMGNGAFLTGVASDLSPAYNTANAAYTVANAAYGVANDSYTIANGAFARGNTSAQLAFFRVAANGTNLDAVSNADTLTVSSSNNIVLIANSTNDSLQITQSPSGVTATTYGGATNIPTITVDAFGRVTSAANVTVSSGGVTIGNQTASSSTFYPLFTTTTSGSASVANVATTKLYFVPSTGTLSATVFNSLSDITYKTDVEELNGIELLNKVNPISFKWKDTGVRSYGVIAQELEQTLPELVETNDQGIKSVSYMPMIAMLIDVVKKQQKEIDKLKTLLNNQKIAE